MSETTLLNRRSFAVLGGMSLLSGCMASPDMLVGAATGGAGKDADFGQLIKSLHAALDKVAEKTKKLPTHYIYWARPALFKNPKRV